MNKYILVLAGILIMLNAQAQNSKVVSAWNYLQNGELMKGKTAIDEASADESTSGKPKTWYYKGLVYQAISEDTNLCKKNPGLYPGIMSDALTAYSKSLELDAKNDYKEKVHFQLLSLKNDFYNAGAKGFNNRDYEKAYMGFSNVSLIEDVLHKTFKDPGYDTIVNFYTGLAAMQAKKTKEAKAIFESMVDLSFPATGASYQGMGKDVISYLVSIYREEKDTAKSLETIEKGIAKYPNDLNLIIEQLNIYLAQKKYDKAIEKINMALSIKGLSDTTKKQILFNAGLSYEKMDKSDMAEKSYKDALALDPKYFDAAYELGAMYYNKAVKVNDLMNKVPVNDQAKFDKLQKERNDIFNNKALPYLESALPLASNDKDKKTTAEALKNLYIRIDKKDKVKEMERIISSLK